MEHKCKENETLDRIGEWKIYKGKREWLISSDDGCDTTGINYCPFCGEFLYAIK